MTTTYIDKHAREYLTLDGEASKDYLRQLIKENGIKYANQVLNAAVAIISLED